MKRVLLTITVLALFATGIAAKTQFNDTSYPAQIKVTASALNVRCGPSTAFAKVGILYNGNIVDCIGKLGSYYIVHMDNDTVGVVPGNYVKPHYPPNPPSGSDSGSGSGSGGGTVSQYSPTAEEQQMLDLINAARASAGVKALQFDQNLIKIARLKSQDMEKNNYFAHTSPTYGTPFEMMKSFGIIYKTAGENIAAHSGVAKAHEALMNSPGHRANILNSSFNYIGIGIVKSNRYGLLITQMFVGR